MAHRDFLGEIPEDMRKEIVSHCGPLQCFLLSMTCKRELQRYSFSPKRGTLCVFLYIEQCLEQGRLDVLRTILFCRNREDIHAYPAVRSQWERRHSDLRPKFTLAYEHGHVETVHWLIQKGFCTFRPPSASLVYEYYTVDADFTKTAAEHGQLKLLTVLYKLYLPNIRKVVGKRRKLTEILPESWILFANSVFEGAWRGKQWEVLKWTGMLFPTLGATLLKTMGDQDERPLSAKHLDVFVEAFSLTTVKQYQQWNVWHTRHESTEVREWFKKHDIESLYTACEVYVTAWDETYLYHPFGIPRMSSYQTMTRYAGPEALLPNDRLSVDVVNKKKKHNRDTQRWMRQKK